MTKVVQADSHCSLNFELFFDDGTAVDSNTGLDPIQLQLGSGMMLESFEEALLGLAEGEKRKIVLSPEQAYGYADPNQFYEFAVESLPKEARRVGASMMAADDAGEQKVVIVTEINGNTAVVDFNHPYAGRTLVYRVDLVSIA